MKTYKKNEKENYFHLAFANHLLKLSDRNDIWLHAIVVAISSAVHEGHSCIPLPELLGSIQSISQAPKSSKELSSTLLDTCLVGIPGSPTPLILDGERLYLRRYYEYERAITFDLGRQASNRIDLSNFNKDELNDQLDELFPTTTIAGQNWQRAAAVLALQSRLTVICGGPGTGKTWTVLRLLILLAQQSSEPLKIALAAPTGKAATRLSESLVRDLASLSISDFIRSQIPQSAMTVHRLLGLRSLSTKSRHNHDLPLNLDVMVLDEASMVDLPTMARLIAALPDVCRLILLGDPDQLSAVETGSVLTELRACNPNNCYSSERINDLHECGCTGITEAFSNNRIAIADNVVTLTTSYRFATKSAIDALLKAIKTGASVDVLDLFTKGNGLQRIEPELNKKNFVTTLTSWTVPHYTPLLTASDPTQALKTLSKFRILCALREGPYGVREVNKSIVRNMLKLAPWQPTPEWFSGAPLLITENDYSSDLYNGDNGLILGESDSNRSRAWFTNGSNSLRHFARNQLPEHELCYAMTVHKAQGSEFDEVAIVLPNTAHRLLSREWLYTACSRARSKLTLFGSEDVLRAALTQTAVRWSGLKTMLEIQHSE